MIAYRFNTGWKIETTNAVIVIRDDLTDRFGRNVTSVAVYPDKHAGENKNKLVGLHNTRVITLKKKNR